MNADNNIDWHLLYRMAKGEADAQERERFRLWLEEDERHQMIFDDVLKRNFSNYQYNPIPAFERVSRKLDRGPVHVYLRPMLAVAASIALLTTIGYFLFHVSQQKVPETTFFSVTGTGEVDSVRLPDGSLAILNAESSLRYDQESFGKQYRKVHIDGEVFFDVKRMEVAPFVVGAGQLEVTVRGTSFNVKSYHENLATVEVVTGRVDVGHDGKLLGSLTPLQRLVFDKRNSSFEIATRRLPYAPVWASRVLNFESAALGEVATTLNRYYGKTFIIGSEDLKQEMITADFGAPTLEELLEILQASGISVEQSNDSTYIFYKIREQ